MTAFSTATINCDHFGVGLGLIVDCPGWFETGDHLIKPVRAAARAFGWSTPVINGKKHDLCPAHTKIYEEGYQL